MAANDATGKRIHPNFSHKRNASDSMGGCPQLPPLFTSRPASRDTSPSRLNRFAGSSIHTSSSSQSLYAQHRGQSPTGTPSFAPALSAPLLGDDHILLPPPRIGEAFDLQFSPTSSRPGSRAESSAGSRPGTPVQHDDVIQALTPTTEQRLKQKRSWLPGKSHTRSQSAAEEELQGLNAWIISPQARIPYDVSPLLSSQVVPELWDESGNMFVHLYPKDTGHGPSFKLSSSIITSSRTLTIAVHGGLQNGHSRTASEDRSGRTLHTHVRQMSLNVPSTVPETVTRQISTSTHGSSEGSRSVSNSFDESPTDVRLYMPLGINPADAITNQDIENLTAVRNVFAFLVGQSLVATKNQPSIFSILLNISGLLNHYEFSNFDGSTLGEVADWSFRHYIEELRLADVRASREKTIEAIALAERMRSWSLYNEGFVHCVGKYEDIVKYGSPKFALISEITRKRIERASLDLSIRLKSVRTRLQDFDFPSLFAGAANSSSSSESREVRFKAWKASFMLMRKHIMGIYKARYGSWPPKAKSKKNDFEESGLNRVLLIEVYQEFSDLYDMLVDRTSLTTRVIDTSNTNSEKAQDATSRALRNVMNEFDMSSPPVQPPVPFDTPMLPNLAATRREFEDLPWKKQAKESSKKLKDNEINQALMQSYNLDSVKPTPFLEAFMAFERTSAHGKSMDEIVDLRLGQWIFMYVVLQSLPMVVVDAPGVRWTSGVEYFLCEVPKGAAPWAKDDLGPKKSWYGVAGGAGLVSLPADIVDHGVEGIYRRSHCWQAAERWTGQGEFVESPDFKRDFNNGSMPPPPIMVPDVGPKSRSVSPGGRNRRDSVSLGLEALPLPQGVSPTGSKPSSAYDPTISFENILGTSSLSGKKK